MIPAFPGQLYNELLGELHRIENLQLPEEKELEECFGASMLHEQKLTEWVSTFLFEKEEDEIYFFKTIKPQFSSRIEYYKKRYQALLFKPAFPKDQVRFFEYETDKTALFFSENASFYQYYKAEESYDDHIYFLRSCAEDTHPTDPCHSTTGYDLLAGTILGLEMYVNYVRAQMEKLL